MLSTILINLHLKNSKYIFTFILVCRVNFRKYEPPKFDVSNSAVYKLVHNIEAKNTGGIENRPEIVAAEEDFYYHKPVIKN